MKALLLTIGDEILLGNIVNTNAAFIGRSLAEHGINVAQNLTVGDDPEAIYNAVAYAMANFEVVISTGGLGPTADDITKLQIARYFNQQLVLDDALLAALKQRFESRGIRMAETNLSQAMVLEHGQNLLNPNGTAPGIWVEKDGRHFFALPGVPKEMQWLLLNEVIPRLKPRAGGLVTRFRMVLTTGIPESTLAEKLQPVESRPQQFTLAYLPSLSHGVRLRLTVYNRPAEEAEAILAEGERQIREQVERYIYGRDMDTLSAVVGRLLIAQQKTLATAESCTGGLVGHLLTETPGSSAYFERGCITYSNQAKIDLLNVKPETLQAFGAVSEETAIEMAQGVNRLAGTDFGLATTGIAGPTGATPAKPVGLVYIALATPDKTITHKLMMPGDRSDIKLRAANMALELLRRYLLNPSA